MFPNREAPLVGRGGVAERCEKQKERDLHFVGRSLMYTRTLNSLLVDRAAAATRVQKEATESIINISTQGHSDISKQKLPKNHCATMRSIWKAC
eukprot:2891836-Prymnesium_polylepis.1